MSDDNGKKRLGRGLAALMGDLDQVPSTSDQDMAPEVKGRLRGDRTVPIEKIRANPNNPRQFFSDNELDDLTQSIKEHGVVQPLLVRPAKGEDLGGAIYEIIAGERRWRASQRAGLHEVPVIIRAVEDKQALELAIIENVQRSDLNSVEEAMGYQQLIDEYDYTQHDLAKVIGKSRSHVANTLRLLKLPDNVRSMVTDGLLSAGHARTLVNASDPEKLARRIVDGGLSVRQAELLAQEPEDDTSKKPTNSQNKTQKSADIRALEQRLETQLGLKIDLRHGEKEKGEMRIKYSTLEQLEEVCRRLENGF